MRYDSPMRCAIVLVMVMPTLAWADDGVRELAQWLPQVAPVKGLDKAPVRAPPWCAAAKERDEQWGYNIKNKLEDFKPEILNDTRLFQAAGLVCNAPNNPIAQRAAAVIEQYWINDSGLSEADAVVSLSARVDIAGFEAERDKLCTNMPEVDGTDEARGLAEGARTFVGCDTEPLWMVGRNIDELGQYVDRGPVEDDPVLRLAWSLYRLRIDLDPSEGPAYAVPAYAIDQFDMHVPADAVMHRLDAAPYKGSRFAHIVAMESLARAHLLATRFEALVAANTTDATWKELIVTTPQRGAAAWLAAVAHHKDAVARSDEVAHKLHAHESVKGCEAELRPDVAAIFKKVKHDNVSMIGDQISDDPIAGMLIERLVRCMAEDGEKTAADRFGNVAAGVRIVRGPRMAAYFAMMDALGALKNRTTFHTGNIPELNRPNEDHPSIDANTGPEGVVKSVSKVAKGTYVTFVQHRHQVMEQKCVDGTKIDRIDPKTGDVTYRKVCHDTGLVWVSTDPDPVTIPTKTATGIKPGRYMKFQGGGGGGALGMPVEVFSDGVGKHMVAFYGFALE